MSDKKALTSSSDHGKFHIGDEDDYGVPSGSGHQKSAFFSTWISRLGGSQPRRGSVGFNEQTDFPPNRFQEEENSNSFHDAPKAELNFGSRKRNESFSDNFGASPGEDCDTYFLKNKFRRNDSGDRLQDALNSSASMGMSDGMFKLELNKSDTNTHLPTLEEGKILSTNNDGDITNMYEVEKRAFGLISDGKDSEKIKKKTSDSPEEGKIFLIDFEEIKSEGGKMVLKPTSRKFSAMSILQNKLTNNWFFRNKDINDDSDNLVNNDENEDASGNYDSGKKKKEKKRKDSRDDESPDRDNANDGPLLARIKNVVDKNNAKHREMNFWQPQGT